MTPRQSNPVRANCEVVVHGNGFLAYVRTFASSSPDRQPIDPGTLRPGDTVRLEIMPEQGRTVTVQSGAVQWTEDGTLGVTVSMMETDDQRAIDEIAWANVPGELRLFRWLRKIFLGERLTSLQLSFDPESSQKSVRLRRVA